MKKGKIRSFKILAIFFLILFTLNVFLSIYEKNPEWILWFCVTLLPIFAFGLYYKNILVLSSVVTSSFIHYLFWTIDIISFSFTGNLVIGIAAYIYTISFPKFILTFQGLYALPFLGLPSLLLRKH